MYTRGEDGVWHRDGSSQGLDYSDGDAAEEYILRAVMAADDRTALSEELEASAVDWPSTYHLSRQRHLIARPLGVRPGERVLELGAGTGSIARYLGEIGAKVDAVEGSMRRARIAASRTRDLPGVRVFLDDALAFTSSEKYDWVLLIGVLEYAPRFVKGDDPAVRLLRAVKEHLAVGGRYAVAIENRMGLKYLAGFSEDHLGVPGVGVERRYGPTDPTTYSREELSRLLASVGLPVSSLLLPFPDYKLPITILSEEAARMPALAQNLLADMRSADYSGRPLVSFDDRLVRRSIAGSELLVELADSFLAVGAASGSTAWEPSALCWHYSVASRRSLFACETKVIPSSEGGRHRVTKQRLDGSSEPRPVGQTGVVHRVLEAPFSEGRSILSQLLDSLSRCDEDDVDGVVRSCLQWCLAALGEMSVEDRGARAAPSVVDGSLFDFIPRNVLINEETGQASFIDDEWIVEGELEGQRVLHRIALEIARTVESVFPGQVVQEKVWRVLQEFGFAAAERERLLEEELIFQAEIGGGNAAQFSFVGVSAVMHAEALSADIAALRAEITRLAADSGRCEAERAWWEDQFHRLRARRSVGLLLRALDGVGRFRRS